MVVLVVARDAACRTAMAQSGTGFLVRGRFVTSAGSARGWKGSSSLLVIVGEFLLEPPEHYS